MAANGWTDELLDRMRGTGDPIRGRRHRRDLRAGAAEQVRQSLLGFGRNSDAVPEGLPPKLQRHFTETAALPAWADRKQMVRGHELLGR
ncbi:hypothetical protein [Kitasatospora sp. NPDC096204]|uniref:hypothetical protein n=1 Tax=Kitasatospora sp. NPDC096204 TaxID=3364094 RepID=UPI0037FCB26F